MTSRCVPLDLVHRYPRRSEMAVLTGSKRSPFMATLWYVVARLNFLLQVIASIVSVCISCPREAVRTMLSLSHRKLLTRGVQYLGLFGACRTHLQGTSMYKGMHKA